LENPQALIITSKNALRALENQEDLKKIPLYVVGDKTAELAQQLGFLNVLSASGTTQELTPLILKTAKPDHGILWHLSGKIVKGNMIDTLKSAGFEAKRKIIYTIKDAKELPASLCYEFENKYISHILFCSPRTTSVFINLLKKKKLEKIACQIISLCLSQDIEKKALDLKWKKLWISPKPHINDLMGYFDET
jgi:uroporphyrinogen-III synthase